MAIGERIKAARLEAGLSQRQLCGDTITRNMLSLIESGKARPSMDTLAFLAAGLGKPMGYFLEEQAVLSPNQAVMARAREHYAAGEYGQALTALEGYRENDPVFDPERFLLAALACLELGQQATAEGKTTYALELLEQAGQYAGQSMYWSEALERRRVLLQFRADRSKARELASALPEDGEELLLRAQAALLEGQPVRCIQILEAAGVRAVDWYLLRGQAAVAAEDYSAGAAYLRQAENAYPKACAPLLEQCYRELGDFKAAYEYACKQR